MRVGLIGIGGVYNFGCEAIVRGTTKFLKMCCSDVQVVYYSFNYDYDKQHLSDLNIEIVPVQKKRTFLKRLRNKFYRMANSEKCELFYDYEKIINDAEMFFFIGGDIYTIPEAQRQQKKYPYVNPLVEFGALASKRRKPIILYGASVGPFGAYVPAVAYYTKALKSYVTILCREKATVEYLRTMHLSNMAFSPDPAFLVNGWAEVEKRKSEVGQYIGMNVSPLSLKELFGVVDEPQTIAWMGALLRSIQRKFQKDILLLPHVISANPLDNDYDFMKKIVWSYPPEERKHYVMADYREGFLGIKRQLRACQIVISARMHCAINAIHENIPTIFLSYSQKSIGMCKYVYGNKQWVVDLRNAEKELPDKVQMMLQNTDTLRNALAQRNAEIQAELAQSAATVKELFVW